MRLWLHFFHKPPGWSFVDPWPKMSYNKDMSCTKNDSFLKAMVLRFFKGIWCISQCQVIDVIGKVLAVKQKDSLWFMQLKSKKSARLLTSTGPFSMFSQREGEKFGWKTQRPGFSWAKVALFLKGVHLFFFKGSGGTVCSQNLPSHNHYEIIPWQLAKLGEGVGCSGLTKAAFVHPSRPTDIESVKQDCEWIVNLLADLVF